MTLSKLLESTFSAKDIPPAPQPGAGIEKGEKMEHDEERFDILVSTVNTINGCLESDGLRFIVERSRGIKVSVIIMDGDKEEPLETVAYGLDPDEVFNEFFGAAKMLFAIKSKFELTRRER